MDGFKVFGVRVDAVDAAVFDSLMMEWLQGDRLKRIVTPNAEMVLAARNDVVFTSALVGADLALPDAVSLEFAARAFGHQNFAHRYTGVDAVIRLAELCRDQNKRMMLFGGVDNVAALAAEELRGRYQHLDVLGVNPGDVHVDGGGKCTVHMEAIRQVREFKPDVMVVALGHRKQELFMEGFRAWFPSIRIAIGAGGALDMIAGVIPRSPRWMRKRGFEWVWRALRQPSRIGRIVQASLVFPLFVAYDCAKQGRFIQACRDVIPAVIERTRG